MMTEADRDRLRALQDRWLALRVIQSHIRNHGEDEPIAGGTYATEDYPTFRDVRTTVLCVTNYERQLSYAASIHQGEALTHRRSTSGSQRPASCALKPS